MAQNTMYVSKNNSPQTTLTNEITATEQTIPVADVSKLPAAPNIVSIGSGDNIELVYYAGISGSTLTGCVRGYHGTTASIWYEDTPVYRAYTSYDHDTFKGNIEDLATNKLDKTGDGSSTTVTFTEAETLVNPATGESQATLWGKILKLFNQTSGHDHDGTNSKKIAAANVDGLADYFDASTGHDHDGTDSKKIAYANITGSPTVREMLTANRTYYVRTDGNDSNSGLKNTAAGAFLTIQKAIDTAASLDCSIYDITIQIADGTYVSNAITCKNIIGSGDVTIVGNTSNPDNCIIDGGFSKSSPGTKYLIQGFKLIKSSGNQVVAINAANSAQLVVGYINFGVGFTYHLYSTACAFVYIFTDYTISGSATYHLFCSNGASVAIEGNKEITLVGSLTFSTFCFCLITGIFIGSGNTFTGSATGKRYQADSNAVIYTSGGGANYFPGSTDGTTATGGLYV